MDTEILSRILFGATAAFHYIFPPISIGLILYVFIMEALWLKSGDKKYLRGAKFFLKIFGLIFAAGVATGIIMVFQFGTNWPVYSNFVGDIFGSPLAIEALAAFFLESTFLAIAMFAWNKVGKKTHLFATSMVALGTHISAIWIICANSFMQTPAGFGIYKGAERMPDGFIPPSESVAEYSAKIEDFWAMVFSPSFLDRFTHTTTAAWLTGGFFALSICAYHILKKRDLDVFAPSAKIGLWFCAAAAFAMLATGHFSALGVSKTQPEKIAAFEGHYDTDTHVPFKLLAFVDEKNRRTRTLLEIPSLFSLFAHNSPSAKVEGLNDLPSDEFLLKLHPDSSKEELQSLRPNYWPPVGIVFHSFHIMVYLGCAMILLLLAAAWLGFRKTLFDINKKAPRIFWLCIIFSPLLPLLASQLGWASAEVGRQPWIVWHILRTKDAVTTLASAGEILFSLILFLVLFSAISIVFFVALLDKIRKGVDAVDIRETY